MIINQFDSDPVLMNLMNQHMGWHGDPTANGMGFPQRAIPMGQPGSGLEFLTFHGNFINNFFNWNNSHGDPIALAMLQAWITLPPEIKAQPGYATPPNWSTADARITSNSPTPFTGSDDFGIYVEGGIHNQFLHRAAAAAYGEPILNTFSSPKSTHFYQLHGWINYWWQHWFPSKSRIKDISDTKVVIKEHHKEFIKEQIKEWIKDHKEWIKEKELIPEHKVPLLDKLQPEVPKLKDAEGIPVASLGDPEMIRAVSQRLAALERTVNQAAPFIKKAERPPVGTPIAKKATKGSKNK
jgi:hypothetical protein